MMSTIEKRRCAGFDLDVQSVRDLNGALHAAVEPGVWEVINPKGRHALAVGLTLAHEVRIVGHAGYYCAGMNQLAKVVVEGNAGTGVAENMMSGKVHVMGNASQSAGATAHGGLLVIDGDASARCGISMKGINVVVKGSVGHMSAFMGQSGTLVVCGDAGDALGDSLYEAKLFVRGKVASLGADCVEKEMRAEHLVLLTRLLQEAGSGAKPEEFRRYGSARKLYHFHSDHVASY
ncbi:hypothetical protein [Phragmitibacter flavus]|nr:hypothetical protein [Phragmitibacter flavus]